MPSRYARRSFSLILLTIRKLIFTRTHVHSITNQKSVIRNIKPQWKARVGRYSHRVLNFLSNALVWAHLLRAFSVPGIVLRTEQIRKTGILPLWSSHSSGFMNNPEAARSCQLRELVGYIWLTLVFCLVHTVLNFFLFITNCQLLASLKLAPSAGFLKKK